MGTAHRPSPPINVDNLHANHWQAPLHPGLLPRRGKRRWPGQCLCQRTSNVNLHLRTLSPTTTADPITVPVHDETRTMSNPTQAANLFLLYPFSLGQWQDPLCTGACYAATVRRPYYTFHSILRCTVLFTSSCIGRTGSSCVSVQDHRRTVHSFSRISSPVATTFVLPPYHSDFVSRHDAVIEAVVLGLSATVVALSNILLCPSFHSRSLPPLRLPNPTSTP